MKIAVVLFACFLVAVQGLTKEQLEKLKKHQAECANENDVDISVLQTLRAGDFSDDGDDMEGFALCLLIKSQLMDSEGVFRRDIAMAKIPIPEDRPATGAIIDECLAIHADSQTPSKKAWDFLKCYQGAKPKHSLI